MHSSMLIISQNKNVLKLYVFLFKEFFETIDTMSIEESFPIVDANKYDTLLIDLDTRKYLYEIEKINKYDLNIILVTPFNLSTRYDLTNLISVVDLSLIKPIDMNKLTKYVNTQSLKRKKKNLLEKKNTILVKSIDLHPARIGVYTVGGVLFYANENYLQSNELTLSDIDRFTFAQMKKCQLGFNYIRSKLQIASSFTMQREDGNNWYESTFYMVDFEFIIHLCEDITVQKNKEIALEQASVFYENSNEGILITDVRGKIISVNTSFCKITGYLKDEVIGKYPSILNSGIHNQDFYETMWDSLKNNASWQGEIWNKRKNGEIYPEWLSISKAISSKFKEEFYLAIFSDITNLKETDKKLHFYANHDLLTGLANRVQFESNLKTILEGCKRRGTKAALMFIDLDNFKEINDTYGHHAGDEMLKNIAKRIEMSIRKEDFLARIGGDEFVIILNDFKENEDVANVADKIKKNVKESITIEGNIFFMSLSIGIATFPEHASSCEDLIKYADAAMYEVKESGRNGYCLYNQEMTDKLSEKTTLKNNVKTALKKDEFEMYYQAVVDVRSNKIIGAEALVRWNHPTSGLLSPVNFISFIEESNMNIEFGTMVFKKVLYDIQTINSKIYDKDFKISVNISAKQFFAQTFEELLVGLCKDFSISPKQIELELLETQIMHNSDISVRKIDTLHEEGFSIAIDDFGTGYSSLNYLKNFKVDKLKIDQSFIRDFLEDKSDRAIVQTIISLAKNFNLKVQAEGVETVAHYELIQTMDCDFSQGYTFNKPMPLDKFLNFMQRYNNER